MEKKRGLRLDAYHQEGIHSGEDRRVREALAHFRAQAQGAKHRGEDDLHEHYKGLVHEANNKSRNLQGHPSKITKSEMFKAEECAIKEYAEKMTKAEQLTGFKYHRQKAADHEATAKHYWNRYEDDSKSSDPEISWASREYSKKANHHERMASEHSNAAKSLHDPKVHGEWNSTIPKGNVIKKSEQTNLLKNEEDSIVNFIKLSKSEEPVKIHSYKSSPVTKGDFHSHPKEMQDHILKHTGAKSHKDLHVIHETNGDEEIYDDHHEKGATTKEVATKNMAHGAYTTGHIHLPKHGRVPSVSHEDASPIGHYIHKDHRS